MFSGIARHAAINPTERSAGSVSLYGAFCPRSCLLHSDPAACPSSQALKLVVVFIVGGTTFQEARLVAELNAAGEHSLVLNAIGD